MRRFSAKGINSVILTGNVGPLCCGSAAKQRSWASIRQVDVPHFDRLDAHRLDHFLWNASKSLSFFKHGRNIVVANHVAAYSLTLPKCANACSEMDDSNFRSLTCHFITRKQIASIQCTCYCWACSSCSIQLQLNPIESPLWLLISRDSIYVRFRVYNSLVVVLKAMCSR